jgi:hypothetical protein
MYKHMNETPEPIKFSSTSSTANALGQLILRCLEKNPSSRPQSAEELRKEICILLECIPDGADFLTAAPTKSKKMAIVGAAIVGIAIAGAAAVHLKQANPTKELQPRPAPDAHSMSNSANSRLHQIKGRLDKFIRSATTPEEIEAAKAILSDLDAVIEDLRKRKKDNGRLFAALMLKNYTLQILSTGRKERLANMKDALSVAGSDAKAASWCYSRMAETIAMTRPHWLVNGPEFEADINLIEQYGHDGLKVFDNPNKTPLEIPTDVWDYSGSSAYSQAHNFLFEAAAMRRNFAEAHHQFALSEQEDKNNPNSILPVASRTDPSAQLLYQMGDHKGAIEMLIDSEKFIANRGPCDTSVNSFMRLSNAALGCRNKVLAQKFLNDGLRINKDDVAGTALLKQNLAEIK